MYSATFPREIRTLAKDFLRPDYLFLRVGRVGGTTTDITQRVSGMIGLLLLLTTFLF